MFHSICAKARTLYLIDAVKNGDIGLAFLGPVPTKDPELEAHILFSENLSALVPATHPLLSKKASSLAI